MLLPDVLADYSPSLRVQNRVKLLIKIHGKPESGMDRDSGGGSGYVCVWLTVDDRKEEETPVAARRLPVPVPQPLTSLHIRQTLDVAKGVALRSRILTLFTLFSRIFGNR